MQAVSGEAEVALGVVRGVVAPAAGGRGGRRRAGFAAAARRAAKSASQKTSPLTTTKGASPSSGRAWRMPPAVSSARGFGRPGDAHAEGRAVAQRFFEPVAEVGVVDDELGEAGGAQAFDVPHDQRLAAHRQQRLGRVVGERAHALAAAGGEDHRFRRARLRRCSRPVRPRARGGRAASAAGRGRGSACRRGAGSPSPAACRRGSRPCRRGGRGGRRCRAP